MKNPILLKPLFILTTTTNVNISRSEQAPGSAFHPCDKSKKNYCGLLGPGWYNKKRI